MAKGYDPYALGPEDFSADGYTYTSDNPPGYLLANDGSRGGFSFGFSLNSLAGFVDLFGAGAQAYQIIQAGNLAAKGSLFSAAGYRQSAKAVGQALDFNLGIDRTNLKRQLTTMSRQFSRTLGRQLGSVANNNIDVASKSALVLRNETSDIFSRAIIQSQVDADNVRKSKTFEARVRQTELENQARGAEFQAEVAKFTSKQQAWGSVSKGIGSLLSSIQIGGSY